MQTVYKITFGMSIVGLLAVMLFGGYVISLKLEQERVLAQTASVKQACSDIEYRIPILKAAALKVDRLSKNDVDSEDRHFAAWSRKIKSMDTTGTLVEQLSIKAGSAPSGLDVAWSLAQNSETVSPVLIPSLIELDVRGNWADLDMFVSTVQQMRPGCFIHKFWVEHAIRENIFEGRMEVAVPQFHYPEQLELIRAFAHGN